MINKAAKIISFDNKKELFLFLWDKSLKLMEQSILEFKVMETDDFFELLTRSTKAKCSIMRHYPFIYLFSMNAYYTESPEIKKEIIQSFDQLNQQSLEKILSRVDDSCLRDDLKLEKVYHEIYLASDGFMLQHYRSKKLNVDNIERQYLQLVQFWKQAYTSVFTRIDCGSQVI